MATQAQLDYIEKVAQLFLKIAPLYGRTIISAPIGQFCKETGFGTSELAVNACNHAGMKHRGSRCAHAIPGKWYIKDAGEQRPDGTSYVVPNTAWYMFASLEDCVHGYFEFTAIESYRALRECTNPREYCDLLYKTGYCTGVNYASTLWNNYIQKFDLTKYDEMLKSQSQKPAEKPAEDPAKDAVKVNGVKIMLDAGHYGKYNRSPVVPEYYESDFNWTLHNYLKAELEKYGFVVGTTRADKEKDLGLNARGRAAAGYDLFISLHSNACGTESVDRVEGIYAYNNKVAKDIATELATVVKNVMGTNDNAKIYYKLSTNDHNGNGVLDDNYYSVINGATTVGVPGVIIEHGFHTNTRAAKWLLQDANIRALAVAEAKTLAAYYGASEVKPVVKSNPYPVPTRTLKRTNPTTTGEDVKWLQYELIEAGCLSEFTAKGVSNIDGRFGDGTKAAVGKFQQAHLTECGCTNAPDYSVGPKTRAALLKY